MLIDAPIKFSSCSGSKNLINKHVSFCNPKNLVNKIFLRNLCACAFRDGAAMLSAKESHKMGQVISMLETGDAFAHDRASEVRGLANHPNQAWAQQQYRDSYMGGDRLGGGPLGTGYPLPQPRAGNGSVTINVPADRNSTRCAMDVAQKTGIGTTLGAAGGNALVNNACRQLPDIRAQAGCRAGSSLVGGAVGGYKGFKDGMNGPNCR